MRGDNRNWLPSPSPSVVRVVDMITIPACTVETIGGFGTLQFSPKGKLLMQEKRVFERGNRG